MISSIKQKLDKLAADVITGYNEQSILQQVCKMMPANKKTDDFKPFLRTVPLNRIRLEDGVNVMLHKPMEGLVKEELDFLLAAIQDLPEQQIHDKLFQNICNIASNLEDNHYPDKIVIPRNFANQIPIWNKMINPQDSDSMLSLNVGIGHRLSVVLLPHGYNFSKIMITCQDSIYCDFMPNRNTGGVLQVGYEIDRGIDFPFWFRTILRLTEIRKDTIRVINPGS